MIESVENRLIKLGIKLPEASAPAAKYANFVRVNGEWGCKQRGMASSIRG